MSRIILILLSLLLLSCTSYKLKDGHRELYVTLDDKQLYAGSKSYIKDNDTISNKEQSENIKLLSLENDKTHLEIFINKHVIDSCEVKVDYIKTKFQHQGLNNNIGKYLSSKHYAKLMLLKEKKLDSLIAVQSSSGVYNSEFTWNILDCNEFLNELLVAIFVVTHELYHVDFVATGRFRRMTNEENEYRAILLSHCNFWESGFWTEAKLLVNRQSKVKDRYFLYDIVANLLNKRVINHEDIPKLSLWCEQQSNK